MDLYVFPDDAISHVTLFEAYRCIMACPICPVGVYMPGVRGDVGALVEGTPGGMIMTKINNYMTSP